MKQIEEEISKFVMDDQIDAAEKVMDVLHSDGLVEETTRTIDLIDAMATVGVMFTRGDHAAFAYQYMLRR